MSPFYVDCVDDTHKQFGRGQEIIFAWSKINSQGQKSICPELGISEKERERDGREREGGGDGEREKRGRLWWKEEENKRRGGGFDSVSRAII